MDAETATEAHPAFAEIIRQLTAEEARFLGWVFAEPLVPLVELRFRERGASAYDTLVRHLTPTRHHLEELMDDPPDDLPLGARRPGRAGSNAW